MTLLTGLFQIFSMAFLKKYKYLLLIALLPPAVFGILYVLLLSPEPIDYIQNKDIKVYSYTDREHKSGKSKVLSTSHGNGKVLMKYQLHEGFIDPYAGITIMSPDTFNLSRYNNLRVRLKVKQQKQPCRILMLFHEPLVQNQESSVAARHIYQKVKLADTSKTFDLSFNEFQTPDWWLKTFGFKRNNIPAPKWSELVGINFALDAKQASGKTNTLVVDKIIFYRDNKRDFLIYAGLHVFLLVIYVFFRRYKIQHRKKLEDIVIHYQAVQTDGKSGSDYDFMNYLHTHYNDPVLTLTKLAQETGTYSRSISTHISKQFGTNFKTYLNQIRVTEAKRLMRESNLNISEIAYAVGFNSPASFNRVFKNFTGKSPSEYAVGKE